MERRVVITGMGIYSCLGKTLEEVRDSLYYGKSGIICAYKTTALDVGAAFFRRFAFERF